MSEAKTFIHSLASIAILIMMISYGLLIRPLVWQQQALPLEMIFLVSAIVAIGYLLMAGQQWHTILTAITAKLSQALPTLLILFAIGLLIGSWMISGTIPYLVYYGLKIISADHIYVVAFIAPIFFSLCTGTSWGSIATIGLVLISVANVIGADPAITTGAIVGGAYFGDKLSPLSDTTNIAAIAVNIDVYQHIHSMLVTTLPSTVIAIICFISLDIIYPAEITLLNNNLGAVHILHTTLTAIEQTFHLTPLLLLPPLLVLLGAFKKMPPLPTLILSSIIACCLALMFQDVTISDVFQTLYQGFTLDMLLTGEQIGQLPEQLITLFNRGGLYALNAPVIIVILVFIYLGALDCINAIPNVIDKLLKNIRSSAMLISTTLLASGLVNALTSSQYANSFVVGAAFKQKYDQFKLPRKVLSRSLEDTGTMLESLIPWSTTSVFIFATLGVAIDDYWHWQLLSLINIAMAFMFAWCGIGYFQHTQQEDNSNG